MILNVTLPDLGDLEDLLLGPQLSSAVEVAVTESTALLLNRVRTRFLQQVDPQGISWEPSFAAFKRSFMGTKGRGTGGGTLFDTGTLFHSIQLYSISPMEGAIGTDVKYAVYHNEGIGQETREFLGISDGDADLSLRVFMKKINEVFK